MAGWKGSTQFSPRRHQSRRKDGREGALGNPNPSGRGSRQPREAAGSQSPGRGELWWGWAPRSGARNADPASKQNRALGTSTSNCAGDLRVINLRPPVRSNFGHKLLIPRFSGRTGRRKGTQPKSSSVPFGRALGKSSAWTEGLLKPLTPS